MIDIRQTLKKAKKLDLSDWRRLVLLSIGALLLGMSTVFLEVGTVNLFLKRNIFYAIGFDFFVVSLFMVWIGAISVKLDRRHGYGGVPLTGFLTILLFGFVKCIEFFPNSVFPVNALFVYKYLMPVLVTVSFWTIASRFIILKLNSLKYLGVLATSLLGFYVGGLILSKNVWTSDEILVKALFAFSGLTIVMKILVWILPQPSETFIRKTGGVQDSFEQKMVNCILMLAFTYTAARFFVDYFLYQMILTQQVDFTLFLSKLWMMCGGGGIIVLLLLFQTRFLYTTFWGLLSLCLGLFLMTLGVFVNAANFVYAGFVIFWICQFLYWGPYLSLLPCPLTLGEGVRLRKKRQILIEPLGGILTASLIMTLSKQKLLFSFLGLTVALTGLIFVSVFLYSRLLKRVLKMRSWCNGSLMLLSRKLNKYVIEGTQSDSFLDVIYFLKILEVAHSSLYLKRLLVAVQHKSEKVRIFALDRLDTFTGKKSVLRVVQKVYQKDKSNLVRARALAILIRSESELNAKNVYQKYGAYLDDRKLKPGAILGFLQSGGESALLAMDGLQKMVLSQHAEDNLMALKIIERVPQQGLVRLVLPLLKSPNSEVVRLALLVAGRIGHVQSLSIVFQSLDNPLLQEEALTALNMYGTKAFPPLEKMIQNPNVPFERRRKLILFLSMVPNGEGKQILLRNLYLSDQKMRKDIFEAISKSKIIWVSSKRKKILKQGMMQDIVWWNLLRKNIALCNHPPVPALGDSFSFLGRSFQEMYADLQGLILNQILLYNPSDLVRKAINLLKGKNFQSFASARGILQDLLPKNVYKMVKPVLLSLDPSEKDSHKVESLTLDEAKTFLEQLLVVPSIPVNHWIRASALYGLQKIGDENSKIVLSDAFSSFHPVVIEAAIDLLFHLEQDKAKREAFLQKQLCMIPKNLILENCLKQRNLK